MFHWLRTASIARDLTLLSVVVALAYVMVGWHPAFGSSTRYDEACREMVELGDWMVPHLGYVSYLEKPILTYWLGAGSQWLFGQSYLAVHLPSGLAALISVLATYALGRRLRSQNFGLACALTMVSTGFFLVMSGTLITDTILSACLAVAWWTWWEWRSRVVEMSPLQKPSRWLWLFWIALGLGILTKGPVALALAGVSIAGFAFVEGGPRHVWTTLWAMRPITGTCVLLAVNLPWSLAVWCRDPRLLEFFYISINARSFLNGSYNHQEPWYYYTFAMLALLAPYTVIAVPILCVAIGRVIRGVTFGKTALVIEDRQRLYLMAIVVFSLLFLSTSSSKLTTYILPLLPACVVLIGDTTWNSRAIIERWWTRMVIVIAVLLLVILCVSPWVITRIHDASQTQTSLDCSVYGWNFVVMQAGAIEFQAVNWDFLPWVTALIFILTLAFIIASIAALKKRLGLSVAAIGIGVSVVIACGFHVVNNLVHDLDSSRLIAVIRAHGGDREDIPSEQRDPVILNESVVHDYELIYALRRRPFILNKARELGLGHFIEVRNVSVPFPAPGQPLSNPYDIDGDTLPDHPWLLGQQRFAQLWKSSQRCWLIAENDVIAPMRAAGLVPIRVDNARVSILYTNHPLPSSPLPVSPAVP